jgi:hypothetical protein
MRIFVVTHMFTTKHLARTIKQLEEEKPPFVFMERIFMTESIPKAYFYDSADFVPLLQYVRQYYEPFRDGEFLVAMKRKN